MKYYKQLITRDGIVTPFEEVLDPRYPHKITHGMHPKLGSGIGAEIELIAGIDTSSKTREYKLVREQTAIILVYEEQA